MAGRVEIITVSAPKYAIPGEFFAAEMYATNWGDDDYCGLIITTQPNIGWMKEGYGMKRLTGDTWSIGVPIRMIASSVTIIFQAGHWLDKDHLAIDDTKKLVVEPSTAKLQVTGSQVT